MLTLDAHLDLSMNAMEWNRDLTKPVWEINQREIGMKDKPDRGRATVSLPELRRGDVGLVIATQIARFVAPNNPLPGWFSQEQAWAQTQGQLAWYKTMEEKGEMVQITNRIGLKNHIRLWEENREEKKPIGYILSLEGADSLINMKYLEKAYDSGLRALGPAHYGPGIYANGTDSEGKLSKKGHELLKEMDNLGIILDATHLCDDSFWDALERFKGPIWASHSNARSLVNHNRQFSDDQIRELIRREAVIGIPLDAWMMVPNWIRGISNPNTMNCTMRTMVNHMDHICGISGNANHIGIGTDLDGGFGKEQCPADLETIADIQIIPTHLTERGYSITDQQKIMHGNWINFLDKNLKN